MQLAPASAVRSQESVIFAPGAATCSSFAATPRGTKEGRRQLEREVSSFSLQSGRKEVRDGRNEHLRNFESGQPPPISGNKTPEKLKRAATASPGSPDSTSISKQLQICFLIIPISHLSYSPIYLIAPSCSQPSLQMPSNLADCPLVPGPV